MSESGHFGVVFVWGGSSERLSRFWPCYFAEIRARSISAKLAFYPAKRAGNVSLVRWAGSLPAPSRCGFVPEFSAHSSQQLRHISPHHNFQPLSRLNTSSSPSDPLLLHFPVYTLLFPTHRPFFCAPLSRAHFLSFGIHPLRGLVVFLLWVFVGSGRPFPQWFVCSRRVWLPWRPM